MVCALFLLFLTLNIVKCNNVENAGDSAKNQMMGLDMVHDTVKIDKDTIINTNMKLEKRNSGKKSNHKKEEEHKPDWSYSSFPKEVSKHVEQFKRNMSECLKEVQSRDKETVKRLSPKKDSPVHGECLIACVLKRNGVIEHGKVNKGNLLSLVNKFYAKEAQLMKKLEKNLDRCIDKSVRHTDECALASQLNDCTNNLMTNNKHKIIVNY